MIICISSLGAHVRDICFREIGRYDVQTSLSDDGVLASDHRPVFVDVKLSVV